MFKTKSFPLYSNKTMNNRSHMRIFIFFIPNLLFPLIKVNISLLSFKCTILHRDLKVP